MRRTCREHASPGLSRPAAMTSCSLSKPCCSRAQTMLKEQYIPQKGLLGAIKRQPKVRHELRPGSCFASHCTLQSRLFNQGAFTGSTLPACDAAHASTLTPTRTQSDCYSADVVVTGAGLQLRL